jgi:hypothetical protein
MKTKIAVVVAGMIVMAGLCQAVTVAWDPPTNNVDGTALTDLGGYKIYWGHHPGTYDTNHDVGNVTADAVTFPGMTGLIYFAATAYNTNNVESDFSAELVWCAFAPTNPVINSHPYSAKTSKLTLSGLAPTKNTDGSSCATQVVAYIVGYGPTSRGAAAYAYTQTSNVVNQVVNIASNSGTWYVSMCASNQWGAVGPWSPEISFGTSTPKPPKLKAIVPLDFRQ